MIYWEQTVNLYHIYKWSWPHVSKVFGLINRMGETPKQIFIVTMPMLTYVGNVLKDFSTLNPEANFYTKLFWDLE